MSKFEKSQRVAVPGGDGAQGVIIDIVESVPGFPVYALRWLTSDGETQTGSCGEGDLAAANRSVWVASGGGGGTSGVAEAIITLARKRMTPKRKPASIARKLRNRKR
jgi:hypothetical protein